MSSLASVLNASFSPAPSIRQQSERALADLQSQPGFGQLALALVQDASAQDATRLGSALAFKNWVRFSWATDEAVHVITEADRDQIKALIVSVMVALATKPALQIQIGEAISLIAEVDFPHQWQGLMDELGASLQASDFTVNNSILKTVHSICGRWRSLFRSDDLFREIKFVLERFAGRFLQLFQRTDELLSAAAALPPPASPATLLETLYLLVHIYHDLNSQDLPEFFEDNNKYFMPLLHKHLIAVYPTLPEPPAEEEDADETMHEKVKAAICDAVELYAKQYTEEFPDLDKFVETVWTLLQRLGQSRRYDALVNRAVSFLSAVVRMPGKASLFQSDATLQGLCQHIVLPNMNMRDFEVELFEEDASEYVRRDIEGSAESGTRRHAASDFVRALLEQFEVGVTKIMESYIGGYLQQYNADRLANWKAKDTAIFLLTSVASRSVSTASQGVTSTNNLISLVDFFAQQIVPDLQCPASSINPIIRADAIKFLHTFRSQLTKEQLIAVLPLLIPHLRDPAQVIHTYAAMTIERTLFVKHHGRPLFSSNDIQPYAQDIILANLQKLEAGSTPQLISQNDQLMKCIMRVILVTRSALASIYAPILDRLVKIVTEISKNPSNPQFNHYTFESISALVRFVIPAKPDALAQVEQALFPPFQYILANDVAEFAPFAFQILSQLVELHATGMPEAYKALIPGLLMAGMWTSRGNVPALVRLVRAFLAKGAFESTQFGSLRDVLRYLFPQKTHDASSFDLSEALVQYSPSAALQPIITDMFILMLTRLMTNKTPVFTTRYIRFLCLIFALRKPGLDADEVISIFERIQPGCFAQMLSSVLPDVPKTPQKDRKLLAVGLVRLLTESAAIVTPPISQAWAPAMNAVLKLLILPQEVHKTNLQTEVDADEVVVQDLEAAGYQASFSRLGAADLMSIDPVQDVSDPQQLIAQQLASASRARPGVYRALIGTVAPELSGPLQDYMHANGLVLS